MKTNSTTKRMLATFALLLFLVPVIPLSAWAQNTVTTTVTSENITSKSTVYVGKVVVDGTPMVKYLYSGNISIKEVVIQNLLDGLKGMEDSDYANLLEGQEFDYSAESKGFALCSDSELATAMDANWSSAQYVGTQYFPNNPVTSENNSNLYDVDTGFKAVLDAQVDARKEIIEKLADVKKCIVSHLDSRTVTDVYYTIVDGQVVRHIDATIIYDSEAITVIYTEAELESSTNTTQQAVDLGLPSGTLWATCNVGANEPQEVGLFFAWGDTEGHGNDLSDGYLFNWENYKWCEVVGYESFFTKYCSDSSRGKDGFTDGKSELDQEDDAAYVNWGSQWRTPSFEQLDELKNKCTWTPTTLQGVDGYEVKGPNGNSIFLPTTGWRIDDMLNDGGAYWSRSVNPEDVGGAYFLGWDDLGWYSFGGRTDGQCIRPVKNTVDTFDPNTTPLTFEAVEDGTITVIYDESAEFGAIQYSMNGDDWTDVEWNQPISLTTGDVICFRGNNGTTYNGEAWAGIQFECSNTCYLYGNVMSLISSTDFETLTELTTDYCFAYLFVDSQWEGNNTITNHPTKDIVLPATTLTDYCYQGMFWGCRGLTRPPVLPATTLAMGCYQDMFSSTGLKTAPELPATTLAPQCYMMMFNDCSSLTVAPELPATTLVYGCYDSMFSSCTSLTSAPELPATTLAEACYLFMFSGCTNLNYVKCLATDISADYCTISWLDEVAPVGTFVKDADMNDWEIGPRDGAVWGIPEGWTVNAILKCNSDGEGNYWATFYNDASYTAEDNAIVYTAKVNSDKTKAILTKVADNTIPAGNAVLLKSTTDTAFLTYADGVSGTLEDNELQGTSTPITTPANTYMLVKGSNGVGFYHWTGETIPAGRGYLTLSSSAGAPSFLGFGTGSDDITAVEAVELTTEDDGIIYDLAGRRLTATPRQGIYVKNGKKYIVK